MYCWLFVCLTVRLFVSLIVCFYTLLGACVFVCVIDGLCACLYAWLVVCVFVFLFVRLFDCSLLCLHVWCLFMCLCARLFFLFV